MPKHKSPLCCLFAATAAFPASMPLAAPLPTTLEEVLVTAQRREESMQETPISVTAISSDTLTEIGATDVSGVSDYTPGLVITPTIGGSVNAGITIQQQSEPRQCGRHVPEWRSHLEDLGRHF